MPAPTDAEARRAREAEALRANLARRKQQQRRREGSSAAEEPGQSPDPAIKEITNRDD